MKNYCRNYSFIRWASVPGSLNPHRAMYVISVFDAKSGPAVFMPLVRYFCEMGDRRSVDWQRCVAIAIGLFIDFAIAHANEPLEQTLLKSFASALRLGTVAAKPALAALKWEPRSPRQVHRTLVAVLDFLDWAAAEGGLPLSESRVNDTTYDRMRRARAAEHRRAGALLGHLSGAHSDSTFRTKPLRECTDPPDIVVHSFDEDRVFRLCASFKRGSSARAGGKSLQLRDILIVLLMHGGGLRSCEPFHLYTTDVGVSPDNPRCAEVRLYHPADGRVWQTGSDGRGNGMVRSTYLRLIFGRLPRHRDAGRYHAGWKGLRFSHPKEKYSIVRWSSSKWGELFLELFYQYMDQRPDPQGAHPFLLVSESRSCFGNPYTLAAFRQAYAKAIRAMGVEPRKDLGTTAHAHRHAYGKRLRNAGLDRQALQSALNHRSPNSQDIYGLPTPGEVAEAFKRAQQRIEDSARNDDQLIGLARLKKG